MKYLGKSLSWQQLHQRLSEKPWWRLETALVAGSIACGLLSGIMKRTHDANREAELQRIFATSPVMIASKAIAAGENLTQAKLTAAPRLIPSITKNYIRPQDLNLVIGKQVAVNLSEGDPILLTAIQGGAEATSIADKIPAGKRLFTLKISDHAAANGFIRPNDHVDVLAHIELPERGLTTFTVMHDVTLISVGRTTLMDGGQESHASDISFFVDAKQAEMLAFAQKNGAFSLSLRNPKDIGAQVNGKGIDLNEFLDFKGIHQASGGGKLEVTENGRKLPNE